MTDFLEQEVVKSKLDLDHLQTDEKTFKNSEDVNKRADEIITFVTKGKGDPLDELNTKENPFIPKGGCCIIC